MTAVPLAAAVMLSNATQAAGHGDNSLSRPGTRSRASGSAAVTRTCLQCHGARPLTAPGPGGTVSDTVPCLSSEVTGPIESRSDKSRRARARPCPGSPGAWVNRHRHCDSDPDGPRITPALRRPGQGSG